MPRPGSAAEKPAGQASGSGSGGSGSKREALRSKGLSAPRRQQLRKVVSKTAPKRRRRSNGVVSRKPGAPRRGAPHAGGSAAAGCNAANADNRVCPICQETYTAETFPVINAPCGHVACASCSLQWLQKRSARTCAFCRAPVLSVVECPLLEQLLEVPRPTPSEEAAPSTPTEGASSSSAGPSSAAKRAEEARAKLQEGLRDLSQGDLNLIPGDFRAHLVRQAALRAIRKGDLSMLEACLFKFKGRPSTRMFCDVAALWKKDPRPVLALLLARGGRINGHCEDAPILHAVHHGRLEMTTALLDHSANPGRACLDGETALHVAVRRGRLEHVKLLLERGAPADVQDGMGRTPMMLAEMGQEMHASGCNARECSRCDARGNIRAALTNHTARTAAAARRGRLAARSNSGGGSEPRREVATATSPAMDTRNGADDESEDSSSNWEESESSVSDVDHVEDDDDDYYEGEEEEEDEEETHEEDDDFNDEYAQRYWAWWRAVGF